MAWQSCKTKLKQSFGNTGSVAGNVAGLNNL